MTVSDPNEPSRELPRAAENATAQLMLPISMDIANMFKGLAREQPTGRSSNFVAEVSFALFE